jgi:hypothetical protein
MLSRLYFKRSQYNITGQAGTGNTFTAKECVTTLRSKGKSVSLTCYTGKVCLQYQRLGATKLHKFVLRNKELVNLIETDERFTETKLKTGHTDTLLIDQVSMVS